MAHFEDYRRSYLLPDGVIDGLLSPGADYPDFDVLMEQWYANRNRLDQVMEEIESTSAGDLIAADEDHQFDRAKMISFVCEEMCGSAEDFAPAPAGISGPPPIKLVGFWRRAAEAAPDDFAGRIEQAGSGCGLYVTRWADGSALVADFRRNYLRPQDLAQMAHIEIAPCLCRMIS